MQCGGNNLLVSVFPLVDFDSGYNFLTVRTFKHVNREDMDAALYPVIYDDIL